jgi:hypothetical protein
VGSIYWGIDLAVGEFKNLGIDLEVGGELNGKRIFPGLGRMCVQKRIAERGREGEGERGRGGERERGREGEREHVIEKGRRAEKERLWKKEGRRKWKAFQRERCLERG